MQCSQNYKDQAKFFNIDQIQTKNKGKIDLIYRPNFRKMQTTFPCYNQFSEEWQNPKRNVGRMHGQA